MRASRSALAALPLALATFAACRGQASIQALGFIPGVEFSSAATDVSADGVVIVGYGEPNASGFPSRAFVWTAAAGMTAIPLALGYTTGEAWYVSANGQTVAGAMGDHAFIWTEAAGATALTPLPGTAINHPVVLSGDGATLIGRCGSRYYRWRAPGGMEELPASPDERGLGPPRGISDDGSVIAGALDTRSPYRAWVWGPAGIQILPDLGGPLGSIAHAVAADGSIVGRSHTESGRLGVARWSQQGVMLAAPDTFWGTPTHVSSDGLVIIGLRQTEMFRLSGGVSQAITAPVTGPSVRIKGVSGDGARVWGEAQRPGYTALQTWVWNSDASTAWLTDALAAAGANLTGWSELDASALSRDGLWFVGQAIVPAGSRQAFRARLPR
jgi:uncharacterized membrane protein